MQSIVMNIEFSCTDTWDFFQTFAKQFGAKIDKNAFTLPSHIGSGNGRLLKIEDDLFFGHFWFTTKYSFNSA